jgi:hypothetical protein
MAEVLLVCKDQLRIIILHIFPQRRRDAEKTETKFTGINRIFRIKTRTYFGFKTKITIPLFFLSISVSNNGFLCASAALRE